MVWFYVVLFLVCCAAFYFVGELVVDSLMKIATFLGWKEFVVAFIVIAFASSLPNLFVGLSAALHGIPQLSFGDVAGNNLVALTIGVAFAAFFAKGGIPANSRVIQSTAIFTIISAVLPLILVLDSELSRGDGLVLIGLFIFYIIWLFSKKERFSKIYDGRRVNRLKHFGKFVGDLVKVALGVLVLIIASQGIVKSAQMFASGLNISLVLIGVLITGASSTLPEIYFAVKSAKEGETWLILGDLMGAVIIPSSLVLGLVALISPIKIADFSPFAIARIFLVLASLFFFFFVRSDRHITKKEAFLLLVIYLLFLYFEIFF
jgi:cation:H+ antiporter